MRLTSLFLVLLAFLSAQTQTDQRAPGGDAVRMWRHAQIRVVPLDLFASDKAELESLRARVLQSERDAARLSPDPASREQLARQLQLMKALVSYAERSQSDQGKSPTAVDVQSRLNRIEGLTMCEACHAGVVADVQFTTPSSRS
jgi:hypothetical protein